MTRDALLVAIDETTRAISTYRQERLAKREGAHEILEETQVDEASKHLIKEAFMLLPGGSPCPRCGGSGRA
jgi:hypothetical protein